MNCKHHVKRLKYQISCETPMCVERVYFCLVCNAEVHECGCGACDQEIGGSNESDSTSPETKTI